jgi:5-methylcytosine-specific restriction protein A
MTLSPPTKRIRGHELQAIRSRFLARNPLCAMCAAKGFVTEAREVDHIVPLSKGGAEEDSNRQGLCPECHAEKTRADMGYRDMGCDADGIPLSPSHPWR